MTKKFDINTLITNTRRQNLNYQPLSYKHIFTFLTLVSRSLHCSSRAASRRAETESRNLFLARGCPDRKAPERAT